MSNERLILTCGLPGAGKTTLATQLAERRLAVSTHEGWLAVGSRLEPPTDELWRRIEIGNSLASWEQEPIRRTDLDDWLAI